MTRRDAVIIRMATSNSGTIRNQEFSAVSGGIRLLNLWGGASHEFIGKVASEFYVDATGTLCLLSDPALQCVDEDYADMDEFLASAPDDLEFGSILSESAVWRW